MFDKIRSALDTAVTKVTTKELNEKNLSDAVWELQLVLIQNDVAVEVAEHVCELTKEKLLGSAENVALVPEKAGVYILYNEERNVIEIKGTSNLRQMLGEKLTTNNKIKFFKFEEDPMYSKRESELLQKHMQQHGEMPSGGDELDDLF